MVEPSQREAEKYGADGAAEDEHRHIQSADGAEVFASKIFRPSDADQQSEESVAQSETDGDEWNPFRTKKDEPGHGPDDSQQEELVEVAQGDAVAQPAADQGGCNADQRRRREHREAAGAIHSRFGKNRFDVEGDGGDVERL